MTYLLPCLLLLAILGFSALDDGQCFDPRDFGAVAGYAFDDGAGEFWEANTNAIQSAVDAAGDAASEDNIQCVTIDGGDFMSAEIFLRSNMLFTVESNSRLVTAANKTNGALLMVVNVSNVEIAGPGTIYGNAEYYIKYYDPVRDRFEPVTPDGTRVQMIHMQSSRDILVHHLSIQNSSNWNVHALGCKNVSLDSVSIYGDWRYPNTDGFDPDSCVDCSITNSEINVADDGVCPKSTSGFGPTTNLLARNLTIRSKSHALKFGSICDEEMSNVLFEDIRIWDSNSGMGIQQRRPGNIHNVTFRNIVIESRYVAPAWWGNGEWFSITAQPRFEGDVIGNVYDIHLENITAVSENGGLVSGRPHGVQDISFKNVYLTLDKWSNYSDHAEYICLYHNVEHIDCRGTRDYRPTPDKVLLLRCVFNMVTTSCINISYFCKMHDEFFYDLYLMMDVLGI